MGTLRTEDKPKREATTGVCLEESILWHEISRVPITESLDVLSTPPMLVLLSLISQSHNEMGIHLILSAMVSRIC